MARAFGKVILSGEHAVVYGTPALACGLAKGATATAARADHTTLSFESKVVAADSDTQRALETVLSELHLQPHAVDVRLDLPSGVGLGASAAIGVAVTLALFEANALEPTQADVLGIVDRWERVFHGNPSGVDAASALAGGCVRYVKGEGIRRVRLGQPLQLAIAVAGPPSSTRQMVEQVAGFRERNPAQFDRNLEAIATLVRNAELCLESGDLTGLGTLLDYNHMLLSGWFLSTPAIEDCRSLARALGALGSKLTGAGGGGCVIALATPENVTAIVGAWQEAGFRAFAATVGSDSQTTQQ
ncbi:MAG TPA: mevalonate kinase [Polyangiaceae bacterium]|jgi:mevalonate kinase|nr:mevalonate kinase [Polyangiaceae bacterium]